ncbi:restriction endonuclease subunit S [Ectothiorhodospira shaposhnikovii]|uniref:restriction endonuclease subunit S n=1 Tax=Ectothiorhodospira shaposhnikovii TaxID=1054 RepID=UPI001EE85056|nr:restriction endonuclease subunit S [Ectothiorhodospira shaposhnikovii]MCG5512576.1 restriction endonuclease subunit S [Ectothiorhodospira shaposhnikovii]
MSFPKYPEYKDSGVEWLGEVPAHWSVRRIRYVADINPSKSEARSLAGNKKVSFIPMESVGEDGTLDLKHVRPLEEVIDGYTYVRDGDVTFAKITPCFENGKAALMEGLESGIGFATTELTVLRPKPKCSTGEFLFRVVHSGPFRLLGEARMYGAGGQKRVPDDFARDFTIAWPPLTEQVAIAAFLDHETARIDALVEEQQRLIELLKEKRQAVISHAVTKGLDPDVPMKDSGVEWLGEVPAHWEVVRVKHSAKLESGHTPNKDKPEYWDGDIPWVSLNDSKQLASSDYIDKTKFTISALGIANSSARLLPAGAVVFTRDATIGLSAITGDEMAVSQHLIAWLCKDEIVIPEYLLLVFYAMKEELDRYTFGATIKTIGMPDIRSLVMPLPPLSEQILVIRNVFSQREKLDRLIAEAEMASHLLLERRSALISAAVTGKIDVRGWRPPDSAAAAPAKALLAQEAQS